MTCWCSLCQHGGMSMVPEDVNNRSHVKAERLGSLMVVEGVGG